jgi:hypothetical protein
MACLFRAIGMAQPTIGGAECEVSSFANIETAAAATEDKGCGKFNEKIAATRPQLPIGT